MGSSSTATLTGKQVKRVIMVWSKMIDGSERYYVAKAMDLFYDLPASHQKQLLCFVSDKYPEHKSWSDRLHDPAEYSSIIKSIIFYYSGKADAGQPSKDEFRDEILLKYLGSQQYRDAESFVDSGENLTEMLEDV